MKSIWMGAAMAVTMAAVTPSAQAQKVSAAVTKALADPARADQQGDDARRKAADVVAFSGLKPGNVVVDYLPGAGYWTRIFTGVVGAKGHVYAIWPAAGAKYAEKALPALQARGFANVTAEVQATNLPTSPQPVDVFWTAQNYHDIPNNGAGEPALRAFDAAVFRRRIDRAAQPGGRSQQGGVRSRDSRQDGPVRLQVPEALNAESGGARAGGHHRDRRSSVQRSSSVSGLYRSEHASDAASTAVAAPDSA